MKYHITVRKAGVADEERVLEAPSRFAVYEQIQREGAVVVALHEKSSSFLTKISKLNISIGTGVKRMEIIRMAKNLSAMLTAGLSIARALSVIERQSSNSHLQKVVVGLSDSVKGGSSFHEALALYPHVFPPVFIAMARAGEESGSLANALLVVALQMERSEELVRKIRGAMIYPAIVIIAVIIVTVLMLIYVVPTLTATFEALGVELPLATRVIVALSNFMLANASLVFAALVVLAFGIVFFVRSKIGSRLILAVSLRLPVIKELVQETYTARASRTLSSLLSAGVPVLEALSITREVVHAPVYASVIAEAEAHVKKGELLSAAFSEHTKLYPILMSDMLAVGEETGKVTDMLRQIAEFYEEDVSEKTKNLSTIIEPVLMLLIGTVVGIFAVSMIGPIYSLSSAI